MRHIDSSGDKQNDKDMQKFLHDKYPMAVHLDDAFQLTAEEWAECLSNLQPPPQMVLVTGGTPCGDVSGLRRERPGLQGNESSKMFPFTSLWHKVGGLVGDKPWPVIMIGECVATMTPEDRHQYDQAYGNKATLWHAVDLGWIMRTRLL